VQTVEKGDAAVWGQRFQLDNSLIECFPLVRHSGSGRILYTVPCSIFIFFVEYTSV